MFEFADIYGTSVISIHDGSVPGEIESPVIDPENQKVLGFMLTGKRKKSGAFLRFEKISLIGKDVILIYSKKSIDSKQESSINSDAKLMGEKIIGLPVRTETSKNMGTVTSFYFSEEGEILYYEISGGYLNEMINGKGLISKCGVVSLTCNEMKILETAKEVSDIMKTKAGLRHKATKIKEKARKSIEETLGGSP
ncbi:MAG: PRC-barrel domain-containing protein [Nitrospinae bacterium]|nr:PRC-barrel domain-containing protein [Nitrospinota bacterium]